MSDRSFRYFFGIVLLLLVSGLAWFDSGHAPAWGSPIFITLMGWAALREYGRMFAPAAGGPIAGPLVGVGGAFLLTVLLRPIWGPQFPVETLFLWTLVAAAALACVLPVARGWKSGVETQHRDAATYGLFGVAIVALPLGFLIETLRLPGPGVLFATVVLLGAKLNDIGGYVVGSLKGRNRLCPGISPKKTWEGALAGLCAGTVGTVGLFAWLGPFGGHRSSLGLALVQGVTVGLAAQASDLSESALKRAAGTKDSGGVIRAFGGILDVLDTFILVGPLGYLWGRYWLA